MSVLSRWARAVASRSVIIADALTSRWVGSRSYAQCGEDLVLRFAFSSLGVFKPTYLDVGAHHPHWLSNTALFYRLGSCGVNVEPNADLCDLFRRCRRRDANLNIGIGPDDGSLDFYVMDNPELSTFDGPTATEYQARGVRLREVRPIPVRPINAVLAEHFSRRPPDLLCVDAEGLDLAILSSLDYDRFGPLAVCVETVDFATGRKRGAEVHDLLAKQGYFPLADTWINTIFFRQEPFDRLRAAMTGGRH